MNKDVNDKSAENKAIKASGRQFWERREIAYTDKKIKAFDDTMEVLQNRQRTVERREHLIVLSILLLATLFVFSVWITNGRVLDAVAHFLQSFEAPLLNTSENEAFNCNQEKNKNTPYCLSRKSKVDSDWQDITRNTSGKNQFSLRKQTINPKNSRPNATEKR